MDIIENITEMIKEELLDEPMDITPDTSLFKGQILDSMTLTMLIAYIEDEFEIRIKPLDIIYENFDTINNMKAYIDKARA